MALGEEEALLAALGRGKGLDLAGVDGTRNIENLPGGIEVVFGLILAVGGALLTLTLAFLVLVILVVIVAVTLEDKLAL